MTPALTFFAGLGLLVLFGWYLDRKSTRLNSSHSQISYAVFCLKKKKIQIHTFPDYQHLNPFTPPFHISTQPSTTPGPYPHVRHPPSNTTTPTPHLTHPACTRHA